MADNRKTRKKVADANEALRQAKEKSKKLGTDVPLQLRTDLCEAIQEYDKR